jgi:tail tube protein
MSVASESMLAQVGIDTVDPVTKRFNFVSSTFGLDEELVDGNGNRGTLSHAGELIRQGNRKARGDMVLQPTVSEWQALLPWILGGTPVGNTYPLADAAPTPRYVALDKKADVYKGSGVQVNKATIRGEEGKNLVLTLDLIGQDVANGQSFPTLTLDLATSPFLFTDLVYSWGGSNYNVKNFELVIDHKIDEDRFYNSQTLLSAVWQDCEISLKSDFGLGDSVALYGAGSTTGVHAIATFTNGAHVLTFDMINVRFPRKNPPVELRKEIMLPIEAKAYMSGTTKELITTLT